MQGFPPNQGKRIVFGDRSPAFPKLRWSFHHLRELVPTLNVRAEHCEPASSPRPPMPAAVDEVEFEEPNGARRTICELDSTYTDGFIVLHDGTVAYEWYDLGVDAHEPHLLMSNSKSVVGLLATQMIAEGSLKPQEQIVSYLPELRGRAWDGATVQQTLDMTTTITFDENYSDTNSDIRRYAVAAGAAASRPGYAGPNFIVAYLKTLKAAGAHGRRFAYRTVNPEVIA